MPAKLPDPERRRRLVARHMGSILKCIAEGRETLKGQRDLDLQATADRVARMWVDETLSYPEMPTPHITGVDSGDIVSVGPISVASTCAHHLQPFTGDAWIAMLASDKLLGVSKYARVVEALSRRLQIQERLTQQIRDYLVRVLEPRVLLVQLRCSHACVVCRGAKQSAMQMVTSSLYISTRTEDLTDVIPELYATLPPIRA